MNGLPPAPAALGAEARQARKRQLQEELSSIRLQKAEVLRRLEQVAKRLRTVEPAVPAGAGLPVAARRALLQQEHHKRGTGIMQQCGRLVADLLKNSNTRLYFGEPVKESYVPTYYQIIKHPMDLGTIKNKLDGRQYSDPYQFRDDVRLVFENCRSFNPPGNFVRGHGDQASDKFERKWVQLGIEGQWQAEMRRQQLELQQAEAESKGLAQQVAEVTGELRELVAKVEAKSAGAPPPPPGPGREMSFEEKRRLSHALGTLPGERLARVLEIIADGPSAPQPDNDEEYELDIDALDTATAWKLHAYVGSVLEEQAAKQAPSTVAAPGAAPAVGAAEGAAAAGAAPADAAAAAEAAAPGRSGSPAEGSDSEEVGSKGNAGSTFGEPAAGAEGKRPPGDITTFVSATGPGAQPQILKTSTQKKDVQLQNTAAWASLTAAPPGKEAPPGADGEPATAAEPGAVPEAGAAAGEEDDQLWSEFQGRETAQRAAEAQRAEAEAAERARRAEAEAAERRAAEAAEADRARQRDEAAAAERAAVEEQRERDRQLLESAEAAAAGVKGPEVPHAAGQGSAADLALLGLQARQDEDEDDEDAMVEDI